MTDGFRRIEEQLPTAQNGRWLIVADGNWHNVETFREYHEAAKEAARIPPGAEVSIRQVRGEEVRAPSSLKRYPTPGEDEVVPPRTAIGIGARPEDSARVRALIDTGSRRSFITTAAADRLGLVTVPHAELVLRGERTNLTVERREARIRTARDGFAVPGPTLLGTVAEIPWEHVEMIVGADILEHVVLTYYGHTGRTTLEAPR